GGIVESGRRQFASPRTSGRLRKCSGSRIRKIQERSEPAAKRAPKRADRARPEPASPGGSAKEIGSANEEFGDSLADGWLAQRSLDDRRRTGRGRQPTLHSFFSQDLRARRSERGGRRSGEGGNESQSPALCVSQRNFRSESLVDSTSGRSRHPALHRSEERRVGKECRCRRGTET